jgi:hypothetical protein
MQRKLTVLIVTFVLVLAACGNDDDAVTTPGTGGDPLPEPVCIGENEELLPEYVGLTEPEAVSLADEQGLSVREVGRDGECFAITMDLRDDRVNLEFADDVVIAAAIF